MEHTRFTEEEARAKIGRRVKALVEFPGVPIGTLGIVIEADAVKAGFDVYVEWQLEDRLRPLRDYVTKDEYETGLQEL